jgi:uncharacterized protein YmfQ (DUF2313 family)
MAVRSQADYRQMLVSLLPPGPAWAVDQVPGIHAILAGLAAEFARVDGRAADLVNESDPSTVRELVPDWERVMNLPDPCLGGSPSFEDRLRAVQKRHLTVGGQSRAYLLSLAWEQGYRGASITEYRAPRFGRARCGVDHFGTWGLQFFWTMHLGQRQVAGRRWGISTWGEAFGANPNSGIECLIKRSAPAHCVVTFDYEG